MNEIILELAALLLSLFCLIFSCSARHSLYFPLPGGLRAKCGSRHWVFLALLGTLSVSSAVSVATGIVELAQTGAEALLALHSLYHLLHAPLFFLMALYVLDLCDAAQERRRWVCALLPLPLLLSELLILSNHTDTLYAESYRQIAAMAAVNLLMLVVVVVYYLSATQSRRRAERALSEQEFFLGDLADQLRQCAVRMDIRMPVMDGLAAARALRALDHPQAQSVPIIALTANAFEEDVQKCLEAGMNAHLSKPVDIDLLLKDMNELLPKQ